MTPAEVFTVAQAGTESFRTIEFDLPESTAGILALVLDLSCLCAFSGIQQDCQYQRQHSDTQQQQTAPPHGRQKSGIPQRRPEGHRKQQRQPQHQRQNSGRGFRKIKLDRPE